jgi:hypothetical protein
MTTPTETPTLKPSTPEGSDPWLATLPAWTAGEASDPGRVTPELAPPDEGAARADLRRQISRLEAELSAAVVEAWAGGPVVNAAARSAAPRVDPRLASLADLERIRNDLLALIDARRQAAIAQEAHYAEARALLEAMYADPRAHKWVRVSREDLGLKACGHYHVRPRLGVIGMLRGWWVVKVSSGCPLAGRLAAASRSRAAPS